MCNHMCKKLHYFANLMAKGNFSLNADPRLTLIRFLSSIGKRINSPLVYLRDSLDSIINIYPVSRLDQNINVTNRGQLAFDSPSNSVYKQTIYLNHSATHRHRRIEHMLVYRTKSEDEGIRGGGERWRIEWLNATYLEASVPIYGDQHEIFPAAGHPDFRCQARPRCRTTRHDFRSQIFRKY